MTYASLPPLHRLLKTKDKNDTCRHAGTGVKACLAICEILGVLNWNVVSAQTSMAVLQNAYDSDDCRYRAQGETLHEC